MGLYTREDSPFWWAFLEGTRQKVNTRIPHAALTAEQRRENKVAAETIYHQHMIRLAKRAVGLPAVEPITFRAFAQWYLDHVVAAFKSKRPAGIRVQTLVAHFQDTPLSALTPLLIIEYETARLKAVRRSTVALELRMLKTILKLAVGRYLVDSPMREYRITRAKKRPKITLTADLEPALLGELLKTDPEIHDAYLVGVGTLLRQANLLTLRRWQWSDPPVVADAKAGPHSIDLSGPTPLQTRAAMILRRRLPQTRDGFFFPKWGPRFALESDKKANEAASIFRQTVRRAFLRAGLPWGLDHRGLVWHSATRATGATRMITDYGIDLRTVQHMGPWASLDEMATYLGLNTGKGTGTEPQENRP